jgi:hypothetical protein
MIGRRSNASSLVGRPGIGAVEQSRRSWAQRLESSSAIPDSFKEFFETVPSEGVAFPYTVLTPAYEGFLHQETEKLICVHGSEICVLERRGRSHIAKCYSLSDVNHVEITTVLLDSRITISGPTREEKASVSTWRFNAVTDYLFTPIIERIRLATTGWGRRPLGSEIEAFEQWRESNYKFMNYARRSLLGCEQVLHAILQPEIRTDEFKILGRTFYRLVSPTHVSILSDRELIIILEGATRVAEGRYGGTWHYIPLRKIADLSVAGWNGRYLLLGVQLMDAAPIQVLFLSAAEPELRLLTDRFRELSEDR